MSSDSTDHDYNYRSAEDCEPYGHFYAISHSDVDIVGCSQRFLSCSNVYSSSSTFQPLTTITEASTADATILTVTSTTTVTPEAPPAPTQTFSLKASYVDANQAANPNIYAFTEFSSAESYLIGFSTQSTAANRFTLDPATGHVRPLDGPATGFVPIYRTNNGVGNYIFVTSPAVSRPAAFAEMVCSIDAEGQFVCDYNGSVGDWWACGRQLVLVRKGGSYSSVCNADHAYQIKLSALLEGTTPSTTPAPPTPESDTFNLVASYDPSKPGVDTLGYTIAIGEGVSLVSLTSDTNTATAFKLDSTSGNVVVASGPSTGFAAIVSQSNPKSSAMFVSTAAYAAGAGLTQVVCSINSARKLNCGFHGSTGDWWYCYGRIALVDAGRDISTDCGSDGYKLAALSAVLTG